MADAGSTAGCVRACVCVCVCVCVGVCVWVLWVCDPRASNYGGDSCGCGGCVETHSVSIVYGERRQRRKQIGT